MHIQLENCIEQQRGFVIELDSFIDWLKKFTDESKTMDNQTIQLGLVERQEHFNELIKCNQQNDFEIKEKLQYLIDLWTHLSSMSKFDDDVRTNLSLQHRHLLLLFPVKQSSAIIS
ncbi:unnamed protein product [Rotaria sp. Silwood1]|nr:unnamed protein product [Rotaria sp. Silwood1]